MAAIPKVHLRELQTHSRREEKSLSVLGIEINKVVVAAEERLHTGLPRPHTQARTHAVRVEEIQRLTHHSLSCDGAGEAVGDHLGVDPAVIAAQIFLALFVHHKECGVLVHAVVPHDQSQAERLPAQMPHIVDAVFVGRDQRLRLVPLRIPAIHSLGDRLYIPEGKRSEEHLTGADIHMIHIIVLRRDPAIFSGSLQIEKQRVSGLIKHPDPVFAQGQLRQNLIAPGLLTANELLLQRLSRQLQKIRPVQMGLARENITALVHFPKPGYGHGETERLAIFTCTYIQAVIHRPLFLEAPRPQRFVRLRGFIENMGVILPNSLPLVVSLGDLPALPALQIIQPQIPPVAVSFPVDILECKGQISAVRRQLQCRRIPIFGKIRQRQLLHT